MKKTLFVLLIAVLMVFLVLFTLFKWRHTIVFDQRFNADEIIPGLGIGRAYEDTITISMPGSFYCISEYETRQSNDTLYIRVFLIGNKEINTKIPIDSTIKYVNLQNIPPVIHVDSISHIDYKKNRK